MILSDDFLRYFETAPPCVILKPDSPNFTVLKANKAYLEATGTSREHLIGIGFLDAFPENPADKVTGNVELLRNSLIRCLEIKQQTLLPGQKYDIPIRGTGGFEARYWQATNSPMVNESGEVSCIVHTTIDISGALELARKERIAFEVAETKRQELHRLFMQAPGAICILNGPDFVFELINPTYQSIFPGRELIGKPVLEAMPELQGDNLIDILEKVYTGETYIGKEILTALARHEGGQPENIYWNFLYQPRYDTEGRIDGILVFAYEVTEEVNARSMLQENADKFITMMEAMPQISWAISKGGMATFFNQQWYSFTGLNFEQSKGHGWQKVVHADDLHQALTICDEIKIGNQQDIETRFKRHDGDFRWHLTRMRPIRKRGGEIDFWIGTSTDIHDLKLLQQQKDDFISIASHELKTPITSLKGSLQLLSRIVDKSSETILKKLVAQANKSMEKVGQLVDDLLNASKTTSGQLYLKKSQFKLSSLVNDCCQHMREAGNYSIICEGDAELEVVADAGRIDQVIINLVNNAIKYAPASKDIVIRIEREADKAKVSVIDKGPGVPKEKIPYLFERYYRADSTGMQYSGLGLGLYICAEIIRKHDGEIGVESEGGKGSAFWFKIPIE